MKNLFALNVKREKANAEEVLKLLLKTAHWIIFVLKAQTFSLRMDGSHQPLIDFKTSSGYS